MSTLTKTRVFSAARLAALPVLPSAMVLQALAYNRTLDLNEVEAAQSAKRTGQTLARIEAVNAQSAALQTHANQMQQHFDARVEYGQQIAADALQRGINHGAYAASKNYQSPDLMAGVDVEGYINFRQGQINDFNNFKTKLSGIGSSAFHGGATLFEGMVNSGQSVASLTRFTGIQGGGAFTEAWTSLGSSVSAAASFAYNNPLGFAKAMTVNPVMGMVNHYGNIRQSDGIAAMFGSIAGDALSGAAVAMLAAPARVTGSIPNKVTQLKIPSWGATTLDATLGKTTTIIGRWNPDMEVVLNQLNPPVSFDFGAKPGSFNVLNLPGDIYTSRTPTQFFNEFNRPWLNEAISRNDIFAVATKPEFRAGSLYQRNSAGNAELTTFSRECLDMRRAGYVYDAATRQMLRK